MTVGGPAALFTVTATSHIAIASYAIYRTTRRAPVPEEVRDAYRGVPGQTGTPQTAALDPRAEDISIREHEPLSVGK
jgi:hypothetical protein